MEIELPQPNNEEKTKIYKRVHQEFLENLVAQKIYVILEPDLYIASIDEFSKIVNCGFEEVNHAVLNILMPLGYLKRDLQGYTLATNENNYIQELKVVKTEEHHNRLKAHSQKLLYMAGEVMSPNVGTADIGTVVTLDEKLANWYMMEVHKLGLEIVQKASHLSYDEKSHILTGVHGIAISKIGKGSKK